MISVPFALGVRVLATVLVVDRGGAADGQDIEMDNGAGETLALQVRWPDDAEITRERLTFLTMQERVDDELMTVDADGKRRLKKDVSSSHAAAMIAELESAITDYAAALVHGWNAIAEYECTRENVRALFRRAPFAETLVLKATKEGNDFLPESLRRSLQSSAPVLAATASLQETSRFDVALSLPSDEATPAPEPT